MHGTACSTNTATWRSFHRLRNSFLCDGKIRNDFQASSILLSSSLSYITVIIIILSNAVQTISDVKLKIYLRVVLRLRICGAVLSRLHTPSKHTDKSNRFIFASKSYVMPPYTLQDNVLFDVQERNSVNAICISVAQYIVR